MQLIGLFPGNDHQKDIDVPVMKYEGFVSFLLFVFLDVCCTCSIEGQELIVKGRSSDCSCEGVFGRFRKYCFLTCWQLHHVL